MTRNKSTDLNNHLFEQLERLNDESLSDEELKKEIERSKAMANVSTQIIDNSRLALEATKFKAEYGVWNEKMPELLEGDKSE
ncbi:hypothetical protein QP246_02390 [Aerococcus urinae]|uniref:hypothetical protein n=1 Tax=Aerococcus urinae TaxID=1376 RepID=UPI00254CB55D|nr:hypothetical protein [Aerococcus urinae]MDK6688308.1 hypothetical protein [Aerococcus urinae]